METILKIFIFDDLLDGFDVYDVKDSNIDIHTFQIMEPYTLNHMIGYWPTHKQWIVNALNDMALDIEADPEWTGTLSRQDTLEQISYWLNECA